MKPLLIVLLLLCAGCESYRDYWEDRDQDSVRCRTGRPNSITGNVDTVCRPR